MTKLVSPLLALSLYAYSQQQAIVSLLYKEKALPFYTNTGINKMKFQNCIREASLPAEVEFSKKLHYPYMYILTASRWWMSNVLKKSLKNGSRMVQE